MCWTIVGTARRKCAANPLPFFTPLHDLAQFTQLRVRPSPSHPLGAHFLRRKGSGPRATAPHPAHSRSARHHHHHALLGGGDTVGGGDAGAPASAGTSGAA